MKHHTFAMGVAVAACAVLTAESAQASFVERGTGMSTSDGVEYAKKLIYDDLLDVIWLNFTRDYVVDFEDQGWQDQRTDQAALDAAIQLGIPDGGWIPKGRLTEAGALPDKYALTEMPTTDYLKRTKQNVLDSDGTVIFSHGDLKGGSKWTADFATELRKPFLPIDLRSTPFSESAEGLAARVKAHDIGVLSVARLQDAC